MFWLNGKKVKELPPEIAAYRKAFQAIVDEALKREPVRDYNELVPPSNPEYPSNCLLCYYCAQPLERVRDEYMVGARQRVYSSGTWHHLGAGQDCRLENIRPDIDLPRCHVCQVQTPPHCPICSVGGQPGFHATTMDQKENEVQRWAASERDKEMHSALFALFQECNTKIDDSLTAILVSNEAIRRVLKASPWGKGIK